MKKRSILYFKKKRYKRKMSAILDKHSLVDVSFRMLISLGLFYIVHKYKYNELLKKENHVEPVQ
jgi:hypothetical protein